MNNLWRRLINVVFIEEIVLHFCINLYTVTFPKPVDLDHPETWLPINIDIWCEGKFLYNHPIFTDKSKDIEEFPLKVVYYKHMPSIVEPTSILSNIKLVEAIPGIPFHGVEIELLEYLSKGMNFYPYIREVNVNRSIGLVNTLRYGAAEFALGSFPYIPYYLQQIDLSEPYGLYCYTFLTPEALGDRSWQTLFLPFKLNLWILTSFTLFIIWLCLYTVARLQEIRCKNYENPIESLLYTWSIQLLISIPIQPSGWPLRLLFISAWMHALLIVVTYRASFASQLASPPPRFAVNSLQQLADAKYLKPITWARHARDMFLSSQDMHSQIVGSRLIETDDSEEEIVTLITSGKFAFFENIYILQALQQQKNKNGKSGGYHLHVMDECVSTLPISLGLARNSPLTHRVGILLRKAVEMGLTAKWIQDVTYSLRLTKNDFDNINQQTAVSLKKIIGAFVLLAIGFLLAFIVFILEIVNKKFFSE